MSDQATSQLDDYRKNRINPVPIDLTTPEAMAAHVAKRRNLYSRHLGIPLGLLRGQQVLEFGCNSGEESLALARELFGQAFGRIRASRPFDAWWKDLLVNPFYADRYLWSYGELLPVIKAAGGEFLAPSPRWFCEEPLRWYKDVPAPGGRNAQALEQWRQRFGGILTGKPAQQGFEALADIFRHVGAADMVIPYQVQKDVGGKSAMRKRISRLFTALVNLISGNDIKYYNALPVFLRYHVMRYPPISYGFGFQADIVTRRLDEDITYTQIRLHAGPGHHGPGRLAAVA